MANGAIRLAQSGAKWLLCHCCASLILFFPLTLVYGAERERKKRLHIRAERETENYCIKKKRETLIVFLEENYEIAWLVRPSQSGHCRGLFQGGLFSW